MNLQGLITQILIRFWELLTAPINYPEMLWIATPLLLAMFLMALYFGRYKYEELGWNTAFGNSLVLIFVSIDLLRHLAGQGELGYLTLRNLLAIVVVFEGALLTAISFFHLLPKKIAFSILDKLPINSIAYLAVLLVYSDIPIDIITVFDSVLIILLLTFLFSLIKLIEPKAIELEAGEIEKFKEAPEP